MGRAASLPCPSCKSDTTDLTRNRRITRTPEGGLMRGQVCRSCGFLFISVQSVEIGTMPRASKGAA